MAFKLNSILRRKPTIYYEIPERYTNSFYLVNAALFDQVNWYLHKAYEICFPRLVSWLQEQEPKLNDVQAMKKVNVAIEMLDQCNSVIDVRFPIQRENGRKEIVRGFRAQYGLFSGFCPTLGGLRIRDDITRDHMKGLSALCTYKHACMGIRHAGGHGGIKIDPTQYTELELQRIIKKYAGELYMKGFCDGQMDMFEPDLNVGEREMGWIASIFPDDLDKLMVAGKPVELGGIEGYSNMASQGVFFALDHFINNERVLEKINMNKGGLKDKTFIIQGLGNLGTSLAKYLRNSGAICIAIKEHDAHIHNTQGINIEDAETCKRETGSVETMDKGTKSKNDDILNEKCDILVLAAHQKSFNCHMADKVKAKIIVEAANGTITPIAHQILLKRSKLVLPDIYVSSGHAVASYLEYLLCLRRSGKKQFPVIRYLYKHILDTFEVSEKTQLVSAATTQKMVSCEMKLDVLTYAIDHVMRETGNELLDIAKEYNLDLDLRLSGYIKAIKSIHKSIYELNKY